VLERRSHRICTPRMVTFKSEESQHFILDTATHCHCRFRYTTTFRDAFLRDGIASLQNLDNRGWVAGSDANAFVCNHDTERV
jgi:hypothetical protein